MRIKKVLVIIIVFILLLNIVPIKVYGSNDVSVTYQSHLKEYGWINPVKDGQVSGTTGECRRLEAIKISINGLQDYNLNYMVHVKDYGWLDYVSEGQIAGTTGESRRAEAIIINLRSNEYTIKYRVHVENIGWMDWVSNGEIAGTTGRSLRMEAIEIALIPKNGAYNGEYLHKGVDVSKYQGNINWNSVKSSGIDFAMIRCGNRGYGTGGIVEDPYFKSNVQNAYNAGIKVGIYFYSSAMNESEAIEEANYVLNKISQYGFQNKIVYPIAFDFENDFPEARNYNLTVEQRTNICKAFCNQIRNSGYKPIVYSYSYFLEYRLNMDDLKEYDTWVAHYTPKTNYSRPFTIWQYTDSGRIDGIDTNVDLNYSYINY